MLTYKDFVAKIEYDPEDEIYYGDVIDCEDMTSFYGRTLEEVEQKFHDAVDDYLEWLEESEH